MTGATTGATTAERDTLNKRSADILAYFDRPGTATAPPKPSTADYYITRSLHETLDYHIPTEFEALYHQTRTSALTVT